MLASAAMRPRLRAALLLVPVLLGGDVPSALARYESRRLRFNAAVVAHGRELGAWLEGLDTLEARRHHTPAAVMAEIAVTRDYA